MQLSVIIINYNVKYFLEQCLCSLLAAAKSIDAEVLVVDNDSKDGSVTYLQAKYTTVKFIANSDNTGFGKANNQALEICRGKYVLFLNPDTILPEDCLQKCIAFMEENEQAGAAGIRMIDGSGRFLPESKRSFPAPMTSFYKLVGLSRIFPSSKIFSRYSLASLNQYENYEVDVLAGAFLMARRDLLNNLHGFDEAFFMYGEDIDLSYRLQKTGYKNYYFGESTIIHFKGESTSKSSLNYVKMFYRAMNVFVKKHYSGPAAGLFVFSIQVAIFLRATMSLAARFVFRQKKLLQTKQKDKRKTQRKTVIAGTEEEFSEVEELLSKANLKEQIIGRLCVNGEKTNSLGAIDEVGILAERIKFNEIIFCQGYLSYKTIIDIMQKLPAGISFRFHGKGTNSVVGSDSKNTSGEFVAAPVDLLQLQE